MSVVRVLVIEDDDAIRSVVDRGLRAEGFDVDPPERVRALTATGMAVVEADQAVVVDQPMWMQRKDFPAVVVAPVGRAGDVADLLERMKRDPEFHRLVQALLNSIH